MTQRNENQISDRLNIDAKQLVIEDMEALGTYRQEFDGIITIYVDMLNEYSVAHQRFIDGGQVYAVQGARGQDKKNPVLSSMETLRKDILMFSTALRLNPNAFFKSVTAEAKKKEPEPEPDKPKTMDELFVDMGFGS